MELLAAAWEIAMHLDAHLARFVAEHGTWVYALLFVIVFIETGLVVWPFLPGDSLLFVTGAVAAAGGMDIATVMAVLVAAALSGDNVNYGIGRWVGPRIFHYEQSRWFNPAYLARAHAYYERHGGKTIILARFLPIVRTYVPFVAGIGAMPYLRYIGFCVAGALIWVLSLCGAGYFFGNLPLVKNNLSMVIGLIVLVSVLPGLIAWLRARSVQSQR
ncbi:MAG: DedA family protein [Betaproteobacteria bacterium]|nr:DedA family protein [Betaproteobacteria bacterium]